MGYQCAADDGNEAVILVTNLTNGDSLAWCPEHITTFGVSLLEDAGIQVGNDPADFLARVKAVAVQQLGAVGGMTASKPVKAARVEQIHSFADAVAASYADPDGYDGDRTIAQVIETAPSEDADDDHTGEENAELYRDDGEREAAAEASQDPSW